jgi:hypothetical protein
MSHPIEFRDSLLHRTTLSASMACMVLKFWRIKAGHKRLSGKRCGAGAAMLPGKKAEALYLADRTSEALDAVNEAEALAQRLEHRDYYAEMHRLRAVFLTALWVRRRPIESSFCAALRIAKKQNSISLAKRAEATYTEYRRQKASGSGGRGFRLPL